MPRILYQTLRFRLIRSFENSRLFRKIRLRRLETATHVKESIIIKEKLTVYNPAAKDLKSSHYYTKYTLEH